MTCGRRAIITILLLLGWVACCIAQAVDRVRHHYVTSGDGIGTSWNSLKEKYDEYQSRKNDDFAFNINLAKRFLDGTVQMHKDMEKMSSPLARGVSRGGIVLRTSYTALGKGKEASDGCRVIQRLYLFFYSADDDFLLDQTFPSLDANILTKKLVPCDESAVASDNAERIGNGLDDYSLYPPISRRSRSRSKSRRGSNNGSSEIVEPKMTRPSDVIWPITERQQLNHYVISTIDLTELSQAMQLFSRIMRQMEIKRCCTKLYQNCNIAKAESDGKVVIQQGDPLIAKALADAPQYTVYLHTRIESMGETAEAGCTVTQSLHLVLSKLMTGSDSDAFLLYQTGLGERMDKELLTNIMKPCELDRINLDIRPRLAQLINKVDE